MIRRVAVIAALLVGSRAGASHWTLEELVKKVQTDSPSVSAARLSVESAQQGLRAAQFGWMPSGDATLFMTGSPEIRCLDHFHNPAEPSGGPSDQINPDQAQREANCLRTNVVALNQIATGSLSDIAPIHGLFLRLDVTLNQPLYSFGRLESQIATARAQLDTARANLEVARAEAALYANKAYWGLKASRAAVEAIGEAVDKLKEWVDTIDAQLNGKNIAKYTEADLARMKIALAYANTQLFDQQRNQAYAKEALQFLSSDQDADIDESELELVDDSDALPAWQSRALQLRPEIHLLRSSDDLYRSFRKARLADLMPELSFQSFLNVGYASSMDTPQNYYLNRPNYINVTLGLQLHLPLDFGPRAARFLQARHEERAQLARTQASLITYSTEIAKAYEDYQEARLRAKECARGEKISRGWYFAVDSNVQSGLAEGREMIEALQNYFTFRLRNFQATFDANVALAWLRRTTVGGARPDQR